MAKRGAADFSAAQARRIALDAQGFGRPRPAGRVTARHFQGVLDRLGVVQIDSVNVLARAHYMPFFARLGPYDRAALDRFTWGSGRLFEFWAHEAAFVPVERYPLFRHRMESGKRWGRGRLEYLEQHREFVDTLMEHIRTNGAVQVGDVEQGGSAAGWWNWSETKVALDALYVTGRLAIGDRRNFARLYDLPERVLPREILDAPPPSAEDAQRELLLLAARHHGIGTSRDLADYYRLALTEARRLLAGLVDSGALNAVSVEGWKDAAYVLPDVRVPRRIQARALLSPFDPVVWERARAERLFNFHYRIEIYTPEAKRQFGYYVLPFLLDDRLVARVDLKADRQASTLLVRAAHIEAGEDPARVAQHLAAELREVQAWLALERLVVEPRGALAGALAEAVGGADRGALAV
ncbi:MAG: crosslink repair DNA glycosylase YcaQ family protein [Dehalococcoidia bacterium]